VGGKGMEKKGGNMRVRKLKERKRDLERKG
jgi:hypothetical protein